MNDKVGAVPMSEKTNMWNSLRTGGRAVGLALVMAIFAPPFAKGQDGIVPISPPEQGFFSKKIAYEGIPIKAHKDVDDRALLEARRRLAEMLGKTPEIVHNLVEVGAELHIIGKDQNTSDLPSERHWKGKPFEAYGKFFNIDERTRGVGGLPASCGEENLLKLPSDRYRDHRDICRHEFAHTVFDYGLSPDARAMVEKQYAASVKSGLWKTAYASTNANEFFAELTMWYFGSRGRLWSDRAPPQRRPGVAPKVRPGRICPLGCDLHRQAESSAARLGTPCRPLSQRGSRASPVICRSTDHDSLRQPHFDGCLALLD